VSNPTKLPYWSRGEGNKQKYKWVGLPLMWASKVAVLPSSTTTLCNGCVNVGAWVVIFLGTLKRKRKINKHVTAEDHSLLCWWQRHISPNGLLHWSSVVLEGWASLLFCGLDLNSYPLRWLEVQYKVANLRGNGGKFWPNTARNVS
jgi:hypothetical protein